MRNEHLDVILHSVGLLGPIIPKATIEGEWSPQEVACNDIRQHAEAMARDLAEAEARVGRLRKYADDIEDDLDNFHPEHPPWAYDSLIERRREDAELQPGDLPDGEGEA